MSDFSNTSDASVIFTSTELDIGTYFFPTGDLGQIVTVNSGFGEGGFGEGPFGGRISSTINNSTTWTNIGTP